MSNTYLLVDAMHMFHRAKHVVRGDDMSMKIGMAFHIMFNSINKVWREQNGTHVVMCLEGRSWRKDFYEPYKRNRTELRAKKSVQEQRDDSEFFEAYEHFQDFVTNKTNMTCLRHEECEADDFVARFIQNHPDDKHVIVSGDSDFYQLLAENVTQYNGITDNLIKLDGIVDGNGRPVKDKTTNEQKMPGDPQWLLFEKCIRGDTADNIFSAYPGVRKKGSKNKIGLEEAFADKSSQGFTWNNFMLQRWTDHNGDEHRVLDDYTRNLALIDLTAQPANIKEALDSVIVEQVQKPAIGQVGLHFMKFCGQWDLDRIGQDATTHAKYLTASYNN